MWLFQRPSRALLYSMRVSASPSSESLAAGSLDLCRPEHTGLPGTQPGTATLQGPSNPPQPSVCEYLVHVSSLFWFSHPPQNLWQTLWISAVWKIIHSCQGCKMAPVLLVQGLSPPLAYIHSNPGTQACQRECPREDMGLVCCLDPPQGCLSVTLLWTET